MQSWVYAYTFWVSMTLGCLGLMLLHYVLRSSWSLAALRIWEAGAKVWWIMGLLSLPLFLNMAGILGEPIYPWVHPEQAANAEIRHILERRSGYLNLPFMVARTIGYFAIWGLFTLVLTRSSRRQDETGDRSLAQRRTNISAPGLVVFVLTITFAFTDWVMSLDTTWFSTIYGIWFLVGSGLAGLALGTLLLINGANTKPFSDVVTPQLTRDLGNMLLGFTMLWAYMSLSQFLIQWSANLPEEIVYYVVRTSGIWNILGVALILFQFFLPFLLLLSGRTKRTPSYLRTVAIIILVMRVVDVYWIVIPAMRPFGSSPVQALLDLVCLAALGIVWIVAFRFYLRQAPLLAHHSPRVTEVLEHA